MSYPALEQPIRAALIAETGVTANLSAYKGSYPVFTRRPAPEDVVYPIVMVSPDVSKDDQDGIDDSRPIIVKDVTVYGLNNTSANYRTVEAVARTIHNLFHRQRDAIDVTGWGVIQIIARGPIPAPTDDDQLVARMVSLTIQLAQKN